MPKHSVPGPRRSPWSSSASLALAVLGCLVAVASSRLPAADAGGAPAPVRALTNASLLRTLEGRYENREIKGGRVVGRETFRLNVYADGSRCMAIWSDSPARATQISANVCVDRTFRPMEAYARYWIGGAYRGSAWITVSGRKLTLHSSTGGAVTTSTIEVPAQFSIGTHPTSGDGWHVAALGEDSTQATATSFTLNPSGERAAPLTGQLVPIPIERVATRGRTTVPAGSFETRQVRLSGRSSYWITGEDWIVVRSDGGGDTERVLVSLSEGGPGSAAVGALGSDRPN